jgi:hypothetical protein
MVGSSTGARKAHTYLNLKPGCYRRIGRLEREGRKGKNYRKHSYRHGESLLLTLQRLCALALSMRQRGVLFVSQNLVGLFELALLLSEQVHDLF